MRADIRPDRSGSFDLHPVSVALTRLSARLGAKPRERGFDLAAPAPPVRSDGATRLEIGHDPERLVQGVSPAPGLIARACNLPQADDPAIRHCPDRLPRAGGRWRDPHRRPGTP